ncbi:transcription factor S [Halarchaeum nitratireducens]|uniref:Transcription factor S n=1 Tax=Halarchaeum nitratireducens TaxID=489913 RepID=A0A830G8K8_9EURY|nr:MULTISPECIES: transcription factor S [Halarchaeum]MBP2251322.1 DNA-directed RNA polymerase subunit M [Halarchaeum solikamskense]GGN08146.1 transcription factor S [Halarchaeum nitratireducens]
MQFCDECGSMMHADGDVMVCSSCGHEQGRDADSEADYVTTDAQDDSDVIETTENADDEGKPTAEVVCDACGNDEAWYTIKQTGAADEPPTRFFKCTECGHRWRSYN